MKQLGSVISGIVSSTVVTVAAGVLVAFGMVRVTPVMAQQTQPVDVTNAERNRQQVQSQREWNLRNLATEPEAMKDPRQLHARMAEVEQDFKRILLLHNELARSISAGKPLDYHFVSEATAEIKKRASRLQTTLALSNLDEEQSQERSSEVKETELRDAVIMLCKEIRTFVTNPVIEHPGTVNAEELSRARRSLQSVISLSGDLKKSADRLK